MARRNKVPETVSHETRQAKALQRRHETEETQRRATEHPSVSAATKLQRAVWDEEKERARREAMFPSKARWDRMTWDERDTSARIAQQSIEAGAMYAMPAVVRALEPPGAGLLRNTISKNLQNRFGTRQADAIARQIVTDRTLHPMERRIMGVRGETLPSVMQNLESGVWPGMKVAVLPEYTVSRAGSGYFTGTGQNPDYPGVRMLMKREAILPNPRTRTVAEPVDVGSESTGSLFDPRTIRTRRRQEANQWHRAEVFDRDEDIPLPFDPTDTSLQNAINHTKHMEYFYVPAASTFRNARAAQWPYILEEQDSMRFGPKTSDALRHQTRKRLEDRYREMVWEGGDRMRELTRDSDIFIWDPEYRMVRDKSAPDFLVKDTRLEPWSKYTLPYADSPGGVYPKTLRDLILENSRTRYNHAPYPIAHSYEPVRSMLTDTYGETQILREVRDTDAVKAFLFDGRLKDAYPKTLDRAQGILRERGIPYDTYNNAAEEAVLSTRMGEPFRQDAKGGDTRADAKGGDASGPSEDISPEPGGASVSSPAGGGPRIVINPSTFKNQKDGLCVAFNEAFRVLMEYNGFDPVSEPTDEQRRFFADTAYADDELQLRRTILARICTFDTSVKDPTDEQLQEAVEFLETVMEIGAPQNEWEQKAVQRLRDVIAASVGRKRKEVEEEEPPEDEGTVQGAVGGGMTDEEKKTQQPTDQSQQPADQSQQPADQSQQPADQSQQPTDQSQQPTDQSTQKTSSGYYTKYGTFKGGTRAERDRARMIRSGIDPNFAVGTSWSWSSSGKMSIGMGDEGTAGAGITGAVLPGGQPARRTIDQDIVPTGAKGSIRNSSNSAHPITQDIVPKGAKGSISNSSNSAHPITQDIVPKDSPGSLSYKKKRKTT